MSTDTALVPTDTAADVAPRPIAPDQMTLAIDLYLEMQRLLDDRFPDALVDIKGKRFRKKPYWRGVGTAFNLTVTIEREEFITRTYPDGSSDWGYLVNARATAPNGRSMPGDGACFASEKTVERETRGGAIEVDDSMATEHNVRAHANTRAFNRAVSNLVGFGEVSAEEADREADVPRRKPAPMPPPVARAGSTTSRGHVTPPAFVHHHEHRKNSQGKWYHAVRLRYAGDALDEREFVAFSETLGGKLRAAHREQLPLTVTFVQKAGPSGQFWYDVVDVNMVPQPDVTPPAEDPTLPGVDLSEIPF
jgi:hypothetical protein